ncbi:MAG: APC family permease [Azospirillaceae bacterium]
MAGSELQQRITFLSGVAIAITMVVGSGVFGLPGLALEATDPVVALLGWAVVIALMPPLIHIFAYLGMRYPSSAGIARFAAMGLGEWSQSGFTLIACGALAVGMPAFFLVGGAYTADLLALDPDRWRFAFAILLACASTALNLRGVENMGAVNKAVVVTVIVLTIGLVVFRLPALDAESTRLLDDLATAGADISAGELWLAATIVFWAFQGWENMSFGLEEFRNPRRTVPLVYWTSFVVVSAIYFLFAWIVSASAVGGLEVAGISGVSALLGDGAVRIALLVVLVFVLFTNANAWVFGASRAFYAAARQGLLPGLMARVDSRGIPAASLFGCLAFYCLVIAGLEIAAIHEKYAFLLTTQGFILLYGASVIAYLRDNRRPVAWLVSAVALVGWVFLVSGFSWLMIYPAVLFAWGVIADRRKAARAGGVLDTAR